MRRIIDEFFVNARIFYKNWHNFVIFKHQIANGAIIEAQIFYKGET
ncbi:hypothetical protein AO364_0333 [Moraxella catarrhalis]|nr:hypothetical protein AO364_0333 [Moraxella catarrhalis]